MKCLLSETFPFITHDDKGICNYAKLESGIGTCSHHKAGKACILNVFSPGGVAVLCPATVRNVWLNPRGLIVRKVFEFILNVHPKFAGHNGQNSEELGSIILF